MPPTRFEAALAARDGDGERLANDLEIAYAEWRADPTDDGALETWRELLLACCNAGDAAIARHPRLFQRIAAVLVFQLEQLPRPSADLLGQLARLAEDLADASDEALARRGAELASSLDSGRPPS